MPSFESVAAAVAGVPFMSVSQGRMVYDHLVESGASDVLELGTAHGVGTAYLAASGARVVTVDFAAASFSPSPEEVLARAGLLDRVEIVRAFSSYTWWLKEQVAAGVRERFDFVYLDGAKHFAVDGVAVVLAEKLLRPGGWLLMDDLGWTYSDDPGRSVTDGVVHRELSEPERREPHLRAVFDLIVREHPSFTETRVVDDWWGWARKAPGAPRRHSVEVSRPLSAVVGTGARRVARAARRRLRSGSRGAPR